MKVYHGSLDVIITPEIRLPDRPLDYGSGFYTTTSFHQAEEWVRRKKKDKRQDKGFVNVYDFDETGAKILKQLIFNAPTDEWIDFVMANRTRKDFIHDYDIVYGPVANDRVYAAFVLYESGLLNKQELIVELRAYKLIDQLLFHTTASLQSITFIKAIEIPL